MNTDYLTILKKLLIIFRCDSGIAVNVFLESLSLETRTEIVTDEKL